MRYAIVLFLLGTLFACKPDAAKMKAELMEMEEVFSTTTTISDLKAANKFISMSERFAAAFPADSLSPQFLFKAAGVAKTTGKFDDAYRIWDKLIEKYPDNYWSPAAAFLKGFTAENDQMDREKAIQYFKDFLERYPENEFAGQAKRQIELLQGDKSPDDMVREFEQNLQDTTVVE